MANIARKKHIFGVVLEIAWRETDRAREHQNTPFLTPEYFVAIVLFFHVAPEKVNWFEFSFVAIAFFKPQTTIDAKTKTFGNYWISLETVP